MTAGAEPGRKPPLYELIFAGITSGITCTALEESAREWAYSIQHIQDGLDNFFLFY